MLRNFFFVWLLCHMWGWAIDVEEPLSPAHTDLADLEAVPSAMVGPVNVITGDYVDFEKDITVMGPFPLVVERSKDKSGERGILGGGWNHNWYGHLWYRRGSKHHHHKYYDFTYHGPHGEELMFALRAGKEKEADVPIDPIHYEYAVTNCGSGEMSGRSHLANMVMHRNRKTDECILKKGDGSELHFKKDSHNNYLVDYELLPNQNRLVYEYVKYKDERGKTHRDKLKKVALCNRLGKELSWLIFEAQEDHKKDPHDRIITSDGRKVVYSFHEWKYESGERKYKEWFLKRVHREDYPMVMFDHLTDEPSCRGWVEGKQCPQARHLKIDYYRYKKDNHTPIGVVTLKKHDDFRVNKVKKVLAPLGSTQELCSQYYFYYEEDKEEDHREKGVTHVWDALRNKTTYTHRKLRLESIEKFDRKKNRKTLETLVWGKEGTPFNCDLKKRTLTDEQGNLLFEKKYRYDDRHNVIEESTTGDFCGGKIETFVKNCRYSDDGFNLLVWQDDGENTVEFTYYPKSNLTSSKIQIGRDGLCKRMFYEYDVNGVMTLEIVDNGRGKDRNDLTNVSERRIRKISSTEKGQPKVVVDSFLDENGQETVLKKEVNKYNKIGRLLYQEVYDANNALSYTLEWKYDKMGNVTYEKNALGHEIVREYDENGNLIYQEGPSKDYCKRWKYDFMNRMICAEETHSDKTLTTHCAYDRLGNRIEETDCYGNTTQFHYQGNRLVTTKSAPVGELQRPIIIRKKYDALGFVIKEIDGDGHSLHYKNTLLGKVYSKQYPDGSLDTSKYDFFGRQVKRVERNGLTTLYTYDSQGREIRQEKEGVVVREAYYDTFHLLWEKDALGLMTTFRYDGAGRLIAKNRGDHFERYEYDSLGRVIKITTPAAIIIRGYDLLDRVIDEQTWDLEGTKLSHVSYVLDEMGNKIETNTHTDSGILSEKKEYNSRGDCVWHEDALGQVTKHIYRYNYRNAHGQKVPQHEVIDSSGQRLITTLDALGRIVLVEHRNPLNVLVARHEYRYDNRGNRTQAIESVIPGGETVINEWSWDHQNQLIAITEGLGTPEQKKTLHQYNSYGQKIKTIKPDGIAIEYTYDSNNRLAKLSSEQISYEYHYDYLDRMVEVSDALSGGVTYRKYDLDHHLVQEILANGVVLQYQWDGAGRLSELKLPGSEGSIRYTYQGGRIKTVTRFDASGSERYQGIYQHYDLSGKVRELSLPGTVELKLEYDSLQRLQSVISSAWQEKDLNYDPLGNLVGYSMNGKRESFTYDDLSQLASESGQVYIHDSLYNLIEHNGAKTTFNALNQPQHKGETYDVNGNLIADERCQYRYDALDRLIAVETETRTVHYTYDAFNRRLTKDRSLFIYQGENEIGLIEEGEVKELRILGHGAGAEIGAAVACEIGGRVLAPVHDHNGNVCALYEEGALVASYTYTAFGLCEKTGDIECPWLFSSKRYDSETGFYYFGKRYYNPITHRWISGDPIKFDGGQNLYAYVLNNPLTHHDLYGLFLHNDFDYGAFFAAIGNGIASLFTLPGRTLEYLGRNWVPIPFVRDLVERTGRFLADRSFSNYIPYWERDHTCSAVYGTNTEAPGGMVYMINGMNVKYREATEMASQLSQDLGGVRVHYLYNGSKGIITDLIECAMQKLNIMSPPDYELKKNIRNIIDANGGPTSLFKMLVVAHSQGGIITNNLASQLPTEYLQHLHVRTVSSATIISDNRFGSVMNYVNLTDIVHYTDAFGLCKGLFGGAPITIVKPSRLFDHSFDGPTNRYVRKLVSGDYHEIFGF